MPETRWEAFYPMEPVTDAGGVAIWKQIVMRRKAGGAWEYRAATDDEVQEYKSLTAW